MKNLLEHVGQSVQERKLLQRGERVLVAVSGGLDSMVLLHLLHGLARRFEWKLCVAHFNHQLRGRSSDTDERFVRGAASELCLPIRVGRGAVKALAKQNGISIEMAARTLRHKFLAQTARRMNYPAIALAHHADDQVELFLLRVLRGAGGDGLAGMKWSSASPADSRAQIVRPLLDVNKEALAQFASAHGIRHREDATNTSTDILRNRVRHELLPLLRRRFQPALDRTVLRVMDIVGADAEVANAAALAWLKAKTRTQGIADQPVGIQRRIIKLQLQQLNIEADFDLIEFLRRAPGQPVTVASDLAVECDESGRVLRTSTKCPTFRQGQLRISLSGSGGVGQFCERKIEWQKVTRWETASGKPVAGLEIFDADRVGARIILRHWQAGDRFQPIGMVTAVKLQDWFTNRKISREQRRKLIVATTARGEIFWIEGERIGEQFKLTPATRRRLIWRWKTAQTT